jgi:hypothetical protein
MERFMMALIIGIVVSGWVISGIVGLVFDWDVEHP